MEAKTSEWRPGPTVCRCCLTEGCYKDISTEYFWMGKREVYSEMLSETFSVSISYSKSGGPNSQSRLICEQCISRLRDAADFKRQVVECEKMFMQHLDPGTSSVVEFSVPQVESSEKVKLERVKVEKVASDDDFDDGGFPEDDDDDDDLDDQPLMKLASKIPKKESLDLRDLLDNTKLVLKRKAPPTSKTKPVVPTKKLKSKKEVKPAPSKAKAVAKPAPKPVEKKKKGEETESLNNDMISSKKIRSEKYKRMTEDHKAKRKQTAILLEFSKICPFRWAKNLFICFYCDRQYSDPCLLKEHNNKEHDSVNTAQVKQTLSKVKKHELVKVEITEIICKLCNNHHNDLSELKRHLLDKHQINIDPKSDGGVLPFRLTQKEFKCVICDSRYTDYKSLNHHMNVHFQYYICEQCGSGFITPHRLRSHSFSHETGAFRCDDCFKYFRSTNARNEHYATVHLKVKRHRCPHCSETFRNYFQRNKHIASDHGLKLKEFKCNLCPKVFTLSGKLSFHIRTVHLKLKRFACDVCEWKFYSRSELREHMIRHGGERKYQCNVCKKAYARKYTLKEHIRIHENDRRYVCTMCGKAFLQNCSLKHHMKVHHPNQGLNKDEV